MRSISWVNRWLFATVLMFGLLISAQAATITMEANTTNAQPGEEIRYTIGLDYDGSGGLWSNKEVKDSIPAGTTYVGGGVSPVAARSILLTVRQVRRSSRGWGVMHRV